MAETTTPEPITIKKYANRRLYNTATSKYVTLDDLAVMVKSNVEFVVIDAKTRKDITRSVLTQIIFDEESKGHNLLPINFLRQLIGFYGDSLQSIVPNYLEYSMNAFTQNEESMRNYVKEAVGGMFPFARWEELGKQNMAMFETAMQMFAPFVASSGGGQARARGAASDKGEQDSEDMAALKAQLEALQKQVDNLSRANRKSGSNDDA